MIIEIARFRTAPGAADIFLAVFGTAAPLLTRASGYLWHSIGSQVEDRDQVTLLVGWRSLADHVQLFEPSDDHAKMMAMLAPLLDGEPDVHHVEAAL